MQQLIELEFKQDGFSQKDIDEIMFMITAMMLDFTIARAPVQDLRFIMGLECIVRVLKIMREDSLIKDKKNADPNRKDVN